MLKLKELNLICIKKATFLVAGNSPLFTEDEENLNVDGMSSTSSSYYPRGLGKSRFLIYIIWRSHSNVINILDSLI